MKACIRRPRPQPYHPIMIIRLYSLIVLFWDLVTVLLTCVFAIFENMYRMLVPPREESIKGEVALVVGGGREIGRQCAFQLAGLGAIVVCWDSEPDRNTATVKEINQSFGRAYAFTVDISDHDQVLKTAAEVKQNIGDVTIIIHCCSTADPKLETDTAPADHLSKTLETGILSYFWILEAFLPRILELNHGYIVALSSVAGVSGKKQQVAVGTTQFAVKGLIESLYEELRQSEAATGVTITLAHVYPLILHSEYNQELRVRIPSYFGTIEPEKAAKQIITGMRRKYSEVHVPWYLVYVKSFLMLLPRKAAILLRGFLDAGVEFSY